MTAYAALTHYASRGKNMIMWLRWISTRCWHVTISCQPDRPWKSGRVHLAEGSNVGSCFRITVFYGVRAGQQKVCEWGQKYGKFSHFLTHLVVYGGQGKKQILSSLSTANVYRLSRVKVSRTCVQPFQRYLGFGVFGGLWVFCVVGVFGDFGVFGVWGF